MLGDIEALGAYQMNYPWILTLKTDDATQRLVAAKELQVKGKRYLVLDLENPDVRLRLHWIPFHVPDEAMRKALEPFGKVEELTYKGEVESGRLHRSAIDDAAGAARPKGGRNPRTPTAHS